MSGREPAGRKHSGGPNDLLNDDTSDAPGERYGRAILSDADMLARFHNARTRPPCSDLLGMRLRSVDQASMRVSLDFIAAPDFRNPSGAIQGGFLMAMLDEAMATAGIIASNVSMYVPTLEMKTSFLRPAFPGPLRAEARVLRFGKGAAFLEAELYDPEDRLVAKASATASPRPFERFSVKR